MRFPLAAILDLLMPGAGHAYLGRRRTALVFVILVLVLLAGVLGLWLTGGFFGVLAFIVTPGVLPALAAVNVALAIWRIAAGLDAARGSDRPRRAAAVLGAGIVVLVLVPHLWLGMTIAATSDFLDSVFASGPAPTEEPAAPSSASADATAWALDSPGPSASSGPTAAPTPKPTKAPQGPMTAGIGMLPGLGVAVPWIRPGAIPWGDDGRFDLLLLGSDAGPDRWSRRMDVMLLVEIDVATGKVALIGLPRNLVNAPFPPGPARDAVACGCFSNLLNGLYVEATFTHPDRWPGAGAVKGIGAVRSVVSELTGRPIDAVLVADLWGVINVVDAMGGVDIDVPAAVHDDNYPDPVWGDIVLDIRAGQQHFDGRLALA